MKLHDFGGFSTRNLLVDVRFRSQAQFEHFWGAWTTPGRPSLSVHTEDERFLLIGTGTTLEHEFRHYHDLLLCYPSLHNYWMRTQIFLNALPLITRVLEDPATDLIPFPMVTWATLSSKRRAAYLEDALGKTSSLRAWSPPHIRGPRSKTKTTFVTGYESGYERHLLYLLRDQVDSRDNVRRGRISADFPFAFTPRFLFELSAFLAQAFAVRQTYGLSEFGEFISFLIGDKSMYAAFFARMLVLFHERENTPADRYPLAINNFNVDWRAISVMTTWCMLGCADDGVLVYPTERWVRVYGAAIQDFEAVFPSHLDEAGLLRHLDSLFKVTLFEKGLKTSSDKLRRFLKNGASEIHRNPNVNKLHEAALAVVEGLLADRDLLVDRFIAEPASFLKLTAYTRSQQNWPLCPVHLDFSESGFSVLKAELNQPHAEALFNLRRHSEDEAYAWDVLYPQLFTGGTSVPFADLLLFNRLLHAFEIFLDPDQIDPGDEMVVRRVLMMNYGKNLLRVH